jgi:chromosome segregation ATPase
MAAKTKVQKLEAKIDNLESQLADSKAQRDALDEACTIASEQIKDGRDAFMGQREVAEQLRSQLAERDNTKNTVNIQFNDLKFSQKIADDNVFTFSHSGAVGYSMSYVEKSVAKKAPKISFED